MPSEQSFKTYGRWDRTSASDQNRLRRAVEELQRSGGTPARNINGVDLQLPEIDRWLLIVLDAASTTTVPVPTYDSWHQVDLDQLGQPVAIGEGIVGSSALVARSISGFDAPASATQAYVARISMEDNAVTFFAYGAGAATAAAFSGACITTTIDLDVVSGVNYLNFNFERWDTDAYYNVGVSGSKLTVPRAGHYLIGATARILFPAYNATDLNFAIQKNHTGNDLAIDGFSAGSTGTLALDLIDVSVTSLALLAEGDYVELHVDLTTSGAGGSTKVVNFPYPPEFWIAEFSGVTSTGAGGSSETLGD